MSGSTTDSPARGRAAKRVVTDARDAASRSRRRKVITVVSIVAAILLVGGAATYGVYRAVKKPPYATPKHAAKNADGVVVGGTGKIHVDIYTDFQCADCATFAQQSGAEISKLLASNAITLVVHPLATGDAESTTRYSSRGASALGCASDLSAALTFENLLLAEVPKPGSAGLSDDQLVQVGGRAGMIDPRFAQCVRAETYSKWVNREDRLAATAGLSAPSVLVNGRLIAPAGTAPTAAEFTASFG